MQISDFQDATAYVMAKTGCTQYQAEDTLIDATTVEETIKDYYDYDNGDQKNLEEEWKMDMLNDRYEDQLERDSNRFGGCEW